MLNHIHIVPVALTAVALFAVSASAMALSPFHAPGTEYSVRNAQPIATQVANLSSANDYVNPAWAASAEGRNQPIH